MYAIGKRVGLPTLVYASLFSIHSASAATLTVNAGGNLQVAINSAVPGDVIALEAGATFIGNFVLPVKSQSGPPITIRSAATVENAVPPGQRLIPSSGLLPLLPKIKSSNSSSAIQTAAGAKFWTLKFLELQANGGGFGEIVALGSGDRAIQTSNSQVPDNIVIDQCYIHGDPATGQKRGIGLNSGKTSITNSYISDIKASGTEAQAIAGWNGPGPYIISNNYLESSTENFLLGGADPGIPNLTPTNITFTRNHLAKPLAWRDPIVRAVTNLSGSVISSGTIRKSTYYYKVVAAKKVSLDTWVFSPVSTELVVTVKAARNSSVSLTWTGDSAATLYRVYRSTTSNGEIQYFETSSSSFVDAGGTPPFSGGVPAVGLWLVKTLFELKNAQDVLVDGNIMENNWTHGQAGYAVLFTPRNQDGTAPWSVVQRVTFTNNIVRHAPGGINILGRDDIYPSQSTNGITVQNNLFDDIGRNGYWGDNLPWILMGDGGDHITIDHNTAVHTGASLVYFYGSPPFTNFTFTNNSGRHNLYGFMGDNRAPGNDAINAYVAAPYVITKSVIVAGPPSIYPASNQACGSTSCFPTEADWESYFTDFAAGQYKLKSGTPYKAAGTDGADLGADIDKLTSAIGPGN